ncbi:MAG: hypothetical protein F4124_01240 [Acidimicrobiia bacterium]|nr:hypothetical protein [Acidimicrobiia bacterium]MYB74784.1 hypothetical protein [Acidimicrobiia bacterium]MYH98042.1 hypothetical protein [Acidimicrobiia bacterium]
MRIGDVVKALGSVAAAPLRVRRHPPQPPVGSEHYLLPELAPDLQSASTKAVDVPVVRTPPGRWREWPTLVLAGCDEPLADGAPDLRGVWQVYRGPLKGHIERNEQAGNRVVITAAGIIHDMFADGTLDGGVRDEGVGGVQIEVAARFEEGRLNLYLRGKRLVVTRYRDGDDLVWRYGPYKNRLRRLASPEDAA